MRTNSIELKYMNMSLNRMSFILDDSDDQWLDFTGEFHKFHSHELELLSRCIHQLFRVALLPLALLPFRTAIMHEDEVP